MRNFMETATTKDYLIVRPDGARQVSRDGERSEAATCKFYLQVRQEAGLGKVHPLFGDKLNAIIEELPACAWRASRGRHAGRNETLAA
jgi:hypothetical protein